MRSDVTGNHIILVHPIHDCQYNTSPRDFDVKKKKKSKIKSKNDITHIANTAALDSHTHHDIRPTPQ